MKRLLFKLAEAQATINTTPIKYEGKKLDRPTVSFIQYLKKNGFHSHADNPHPSFKFKFCGNGVGNGAYVGDNYVIKDPYICGSKEPPKKFKCPTKVLRNGWFVQPKCKVFSSLPVEDQKKYFKAGMVWMDGDTYYLEGAGEDAHEDNFGLLKGNLTQFDW